MTYFLVQSLFAVVFYPLFLILLSELANFFTKSSQKWKHWTGLIIFAASAIITFFSLPKAILSAAGLATYLIASTCLLVFTAHYIYIQFFKNQPYRGNFIYCTMLILQPILGYFLLTHISQDFTPENFPLPKIVDTMIVEGVRWLLTFGLAVWTTIQYKYFRRFYLIGAACTLLTLLLLFQ